jgi:phage tail protein X
MGNQRAKDNDIVQVIVFKVYGINKAWQEITQANSV